MKAFSTKTAFPIFLASCKLAPVVSQATVTCTKSKNDGGILLYGNFDWVGGWIEVYPVEGDGATFDIMWEQDCNEPSRAFDFELTSTSTPATSPFSFIYSDGAGQNIPYNHYVSSAIDHSIYDSVPFGPVEEGEYAYCITSYAEDVDGMLGLELDANGASTEKCGTLKSLADRFDPTMTIGTITPGTRVTPGTQVSISVVVSDDTVLNYLNVNVNEEYYQRNGVKTVGNKVATATTPRTITVTYDVPAKGKVQDLVFDFILCDLMSNCVTESQTIEVSKDATPPPPLSCANVGESCTDTDCCSGSGSGCSGGKPADRVCLP